ncbi:phage major capsid protein [butyrate-producing bacterium]|jgi:HK97 family phage major capsid protein|nr:phage major capsid protein [butyrate-producing bacterium]DAY94060.1 MAG TPA: major capsid protein [Caudoviricetes sp.]
MNKKLLELLNQINAQKQVVIDLANAGKLAEAKAEKEKLQQMQDKFDLLKDVEDPDPEGGEGEGSGAGDPVNSGALKNVNVNYNRVVHEFADAARHYFKDAAKANTEGTKADGGYTVPDDIRTEINRYREEKFSLQSLVDTETVTTESGRRTYQSRADYEGFAEVSEGGKISGIAGPSFEVIEYTIKKYAGWLPVTNELLADSDANIANTLIRWLGEQDIATRNRLILNIMKSKSATELANLDGIKKLINVTLGSAFKDTSKIVTNDDGLNWMDTLKDTNGRYLLKQNADQTSPIKQMLAVGTRNIPLVVVPNSILKSDETTAKKRGIPMICGDLKEGVKLFDRQKLSILASNTASVTGFNAYEQDMTLFRGILRMDVRTKDAKAFVNGVVTIDDATVAGA